MFSSSIISTGALQAVVGNQGRDRFCMDLSTTRICIIWQKSFTPDALPAATLPIYPGLGPASRNTEMCLQWLGFIDISTLTAKVFCTDKLPFRIPGALR